MTTIFLKPCPQCIRRIYVSRKRNVYWCPECGRVWKLPENNSTTKYVRVYARDYSKNTPAA